MRARPLLCLLLTASVVAGCAAPPRTPDPGPGPEAAAGPTDSRPGLSLAAAADWADSKPVLRTILFLGEVAVITVVAGGILLLFNAAERG